ncbi:hypothetical protein [Dictyobacter aurantiacus]|uniref:Uncharacterized protein n=1 Tax=Dictyobacter aurantiacus TaxID=1936993 RepID=A0A401ZED1_9CHLR|nr:hypothetical protein [Dictyobacter aurantiacus]GCE05225.1 hypothetical protein KDAU_25540 [Dictyobacter aurantiacus]
MSPAELEHAHQCMQQRWYELVQAEQQGAPVRDLERLYEKYIDAVEIYNRGSQSGPVVYQKRKFPGVA